MTMSAQSGFPPKAQIQISTRVLKKGVLTEGEGSVQLTSLYQLVQISRFEHWKIYIFFTKQAILLRRSTVLNLPLQQVFPELTIKMDS